MQPDRPGLDSHPMKKLRALVVDDSEINQLILRKMLQTLDIHSDAAHSGEEALRKMDAQSFDLVFMDVQMPGMDGYQTTRLLRASENGKTVPIIAVTANAAAEDRVLCLEAGMDAYLSKPVLIDDLRAALEDLGDGQHNHGEEPVAHGPPDITMLYQKVNRDLNFLTRMAAQFEIDAGAIIGAIEQGLARQDVSSLAALTHQMKGLLGAINATAALQTNARLDAAVHAGDISEAASLLRKLEQDVQSFLRKLTDFIEQNQAKTPDSGSQL